MVYTEADKEKEDAKKLKTVDPSSRLKQEVAIRSNIQNLDNDLEKIDNSRGLKAWRNKREAIVSRDRAGQVIDAEIELAKKRIAFIRAIAEESSVVDEERLRIAKLHQEMERLELQDLVERQRLLKELEELERDVRVLRNQPERPSEAPTIKTSEEKQQEEIRRQREKHEHDIALKKLKAEYGIAERQALLVAMSEKISEIQASDQYTDAEKQELIEDIEDHYRTFLSRDV